MRTRVGSGDSLSQPWVARSGGCGGLGAARLHRHGRFIQRSSSLRPARAPHGPCTCFTLVGGSRMWCLWAQTVRIKPLWPQTLWPWTTFIPLYTSVSSWTVGDWLDHRNARLLSNLVGNIAVVVQSLKSYPTLCTMQGFPVLHYLPELTQTHVHQGSDGIQLSHPVSPPLLLPSVFPSWLFASVGQSVGAFASASVHYWQVNMAQIGQFFLLPVEARQLWNIIKLGF